MPEPTDLSTTIGLLFFFSGLVACIWLIVVSITTCRPLIKMLKTSGDVPAVNIDIFSNFTISIILRNSTKYLEKKRPKGYINFHNWRLIKANATKYQVISVWIELFLELCFGAALGLLLFFG